MTNAAYQLSIPSFDATADRDLDAVLVALGLKLSHAIVIEQRAIVAIPDEAALDEEMRAIEAAWAPTQAIYDKIDTLTARSVPGHYAKALAASWYAGRQ